MTACSRTSLALFLCAAGLGAAGSVWTPDDLWNWHAPRDPHISPDGRRVVYLDEWSDRASDTRCANLWMVGVDAQQSRRLTDGAWHDSSPRWSPDSTRVAWISGRGGIHVLTVDSGQEATIDASPLAIAWSHDGRSLAFTTRVTPRAEPPAWAPAAIQAWLVPQLRTRTAISVVAATGGAPRALTGAEFDPIGEPAWMRDGKSILTAAADGRIYSIAVVDGTARPIVDDGKRNENPLPSPDGSKIAWTSTEGGLHSYSVRKLLVMNADGSRVKPIAAALDRDPVNPRWSSDSRTIYFLADDSGATRVLASRNDSTVRQVTQGGERLEGFSLADNGRGAAVRTTGKAVELITFPVDMPPATETAIAAPMTKLLADRETSAAEEIHVSSAGKSIQGWLIRPSHFDTARKYPLLLDIADDPRRMYGPEFSLDAQIFAAHGWVVLRVNPRGTPGYGEEFGRLLSTRYPGDDADDLLAAVDFAIGKGAIDDKRIVVRGGLVAAWLLGHSDRFAAVIARRPIVDFTLLAERAAQFLGALPWDDPDAYAKHSPIYFAQNWKTLTLVLAGAVDAQSDELYHALQLRKINSAMVRIPDWDKPSARVLELETTLAWLKSVLP
jgi:dipeptidyl aminopeptidase/acylaminoacyl peptidase